MNCLSREEMALRCTARTPVPEYSTAELGHFGSCPACRSLASEVADEAAGILRAVNEREPDARYWSTIVPRVRERVSGDDAGPVRGWIARWAGVVMPATAVAAIFIALTVTAIQTPPPLSGGQLLATLSDIELQELRQSGTYTNLLESHEWNAGDETSLSEIIADLFLEDADGGLMSIADPEEALRHVDDSDLLEIVSNIDYH